MGMCNQSAARWGCQVGLPGEAAISPRGPLPTESGASIVLGDLALGDVCQGSQDKAWGIGLKPSDASVSEDKLTKTTWVITAKPLGEALFESINTENLRFWIWNKPEIKLQPGIDQDSRFTDKIIRLVVVEVAVVSPVSLAIVFGVDPFFTDQERMAQAIFDMLEFA